MSRETTSVSRTRLDWRLISLLIAGIGTVVLIGANAHLIYVALESQPDCVPHVQQAGKDGNYRAARSAC